VGRVNLGELVVSVISCKAVGCECVELLVTVSGWYRKKRPMHCGHFLLFCAPSSEFWYFLIHLTELSSK
jgi:hypothetical protein